MNEQDAKDRVESNAHREFDAERSPRTPGSAVDEARDPRYWSRVFNVPGSGGMRSYGHRPHTSNAKYIVFGLPKSGNVWLKSLLADYFDLPGVNPMTARSRSGVGIVHQPLCDEIRLRRDFVHGVCLVRDLRDVVASYFAYSQTERFRENRPEVQAASVHDFYFDSYFLPRVVPRHRVATFSEEYAEAMVPVVRYERLWNDTLGELERLIARWGFEFDRDKGAEAVEKNRLGALQQAGKELEVFVPPSHFRRGGHGHYREELPEHVVADIEHRFEATLRRWGYWYGEF